jgi:hypothetical protein
MKYLLLEIEAETLTIDERQRQSVVEIFGEDYLPLFDLFWEELEKRKYFDITTATKFLRTKA